MSVQVRGRHEQPQRAESVVLVKKTKAIIYEIEKAKGGPLASYACHLILVLQKPGV